MHLRQFSKASSSSSGQLGSLLHQKHCSRQALVLLLLLQGKYGRWQTPSIRGFSISSPSTEKYEKRYYVVLLLLQGKYGRWQTPSILGSSISSPSTEKYKNRYFVVLLLLQGKYGRWQTPSILSFSISSPSTNQYKKYILCSTTVTAGEVRKVADAIDPSSSVFLPKVMKNTKIDTM